jgi:hypothetical protein
MEVEIGFAISTFLFFCTESFIIFAQWQIRMINLEK